jgi:hypothetical protein
MKPVLQSVMNRRKPTPRPTQARLSRSHQCFSNLIQALSGLVTLARLDHRQPAR